MMNRNRAASNKTTKKLFWIPIISFLMIFASIKPSAAIMNGKTALADSNVIAIFFGKESLQNHCSGIYIRERIAATAAHCLLNNQIQVGDDYLNVFKYDRNEIYVSEPGIDWKQASESRIKVVDVFIPNPYVEKWESSYPGRERDIAFLFLERELNGRELDGIVSKDLMEDLKRTNSRVIALGYGNVSFQGRNTGVPYSALHEARFRNPDRSGIDEGKYLSAIGIESGSICPGDSGGGIIYEKDQKRYLVGVISGGGTVTCHFGTPHFGTWSVETVLAWPYEQELESRYISFLSQASENAAKSKVALQNYQCKKGKKLKNLSANVKKCPKGFKRVLKQD